MPIKRQYLNSYVFHENMIFLSQHYSLIISQKYMFSLQRTAHRKRTNPMLKLSLGVYYCCEIQHFHLVVKTDTAHSHVFSDHFRFNCARAFYLERSNTLFC